MKVKCQIDSPIPFGQAPTSGRCKGKPFRIDQVNDHTLLLEVPEGVTIHDLLASLSNAEGINAVPVYEGTKTSSLATDIHEEMERLVKYHEWEIDVLEPKISINIHDPAIDKMIPSGKLIWNSIFAKRKPVVNLNLWVNTEEANDFVYLPNDISKQGDAVEESISNALYTEVMVNAYRNLCRSKNIDPYVRLVDGSLLQCRIMLPMDGSQHTVPTETAARLANSTLVNFDDSAFAKDFISCVCDLTPAEFEKEPVRRRVLAKVEHILMGRSSHTYNQRFIHAIYEEFTNVDETTPWWQYRADIAKGVMGILTQMVVESLVLEDNKEIFIARICSLGFAEFAEPIGVAFDKCKGV
jgi:hypothetical protein